MSKEGTTAIDPLRVLPAGPDEAEAEAIIAHLRPLVDALAGTFGPSLEVVLHDLRTPERSIVVIANGHVSGRRVGGPIIGGPVQDKALRLLRERSTVPRAMISYTTRTPNGRDLKSTSIVYYDGRTGEPIVALCLNYDLTTFQAARAALDALVRTDGPIAGDEMVREATQAQTDLTAMIRSMIEKAIGDIGKPVALMSKEEKSAVVAALDESGLFAIRGAVERVAHALAISRFTVYNYLKESRNKS